VSFAAGWQPQDFVLAPGAYAKRQQRMFDAIATVRRLWRGESVEFPGHEGQPVPVQTRPRPLQPELPVWVTAASHPRTFAEAGRRGCHVLTHLLGQSIDELATKVQVYRQAWREAGHAGQGQVALMLHAFVGEDEDAVREIARAPLKGYLRSALDLIRRADWHFPTYAAGPGLDAQPLSASEEDALLDHAFDRYWRSSALIGTPAHCLRQLQAVQDAGVDEVACLIDFGIAADTVLTHLVHLQALRLKACHGAPEAIGARQAQEAPEARSARALSIGQALITHRITHLQCTPSQAGILLADATGRQALSQLSVLMVGGEALPAPLAARLQEAVGGQVMNMYGPTEATVWASCAPVTAVGPLAQAGGSAPLGLPLINTTLHVRTPWGQECPAGVPGELFIGGAGLARGYLGRPALTAQRFIDDPLRPGRRLYRTGDEVRRHRDGRLEFLGRLDDQVKVQGHRVELGEIEAALLRQPGVREAAVVAVQDDAGQTVLQAFVTPQAGAAPQPLDLARALAAQLPEAWLPQSIALRNVLPHTPNGKVDRQALRAASAGRFRANDPVAAERLAVAPSPSAQRSRASDPAAALTETPTASLIVSPAALEPVVAQAWCRVLGRTEMPQGVNFFDVGGHSLAAIQVQRLLREMTGVEVAVIDMFRLTTVQALARHLAHQLTADGQSGGTGEPGVDEPGADEPQAPGLRTDPMRQALTQAQERARARRALRPGTQPSV
jgi:natural product biosynthesis luciferase-like monooxygenase protein